MLEPHHLAWLAAHPHRSPEWLSERFRDGFDIHHIDGDHDNNDPANLVLIEHTDHMRLHGMGKTIGRLKPKAPKPPRLEHRPKPTVRYDHRKARLVPVRGY